MWLGALIVFLIIGLIAGLVARAVIPGKQPMGVVGTMLLGMVGSIVGGLVGSLFSSRGDVFSLRPAGLLMSILGAVVVLLLLTMARGRRRAHV